jgi:hypothetical protein
MKRRNISKDILLSVLFCALVAALTCSSVYAATVTTDKPDYSPGEIVMITGSGWEPGEAVTLFLHEEPIVDPNVDPDSWLEPAPIADPDGNIYAEFIVQPNDVGVTFTLTATGVSSGLTAVTTFTDAPAPCDSNADCSNGCRVCNKEAGQDRGQCTGTKVADSTTCNDDGNSCTNDACNDGECTHTTKTDGEACDDSTVCNGHETCQAGTCTAGTPLDCDDVNICTDDSCDAVNGCQHANNTLPCDDSTVCNGREVCGGGTCNPGTPLDCDDVNICTDDSCDAVNGCQHANNTLPCDDSTVCNGREVCGGGTCNPGTPLDCDDVNICTDDSCDAVNGCQHANNTAPCDDGLFCTKTDTCSEGTCSVHSGDPCEDGPTCDNVCNEEADNCLTTCSLVTSSSLCPFDVDTSTEDVSDFRLIFTPDQSVSISKLHASNPGQFVYNVLLVDGLSDSIEINIPYPFVTQGAMPVHIYDSVTVDPSGCFIPGNEITSEFTIGGVPVIESPATINVSGPYTGLVYIWVHLDYGLKKSTGYSKVYDMCDLTSLTDNDADGNIANGNIDVCDNGSYTFSNSETDPDTIKNINAFKRNPGIGGTLLGSYANDPIPNVKVQIYDSTGAKLLATVYTDEDGWYMWQYKYTGKSATFVVKLPGLKLLQQVTMKSNRFVLVDFTVPQL